MDFSPFLITHENVTSVSPTFSSIYMFNKNHKKNFHSITINDNFRECSKKTGNTKGIHIKHRVTKKQCAWFSHVTKIITSKGITQQMYLIKILKSELNKIFFYLHHLCSAHRHKTLTGITKNI